MIVPVGHNHVVLSAPSGVVQVVDPAANTGGVIIRTGEITLGTGALNLHTGATPPANHGDHTGPLIFNGVAVTRTAIYMPYPLSIPAGFGLWATISAGSDAALSLTWDMIS